MGIGALAGWCHRHRRFVAAAWIVAVVTVVLGSELAGGHYSRSVTLPNLESEQAHDLLRERFPATAGPSVQVVFEAAAGVDDPGVRTRLERLFGHLRDLPGVTSVDDFYGPGPRPVAPGGRIGFTTARLSGVGERATARAVVREVERARAPGLRVEAGGEPVSELYPPSTGRAELFGVGAAIVILLISFGSVIAMGLPVGTAIAGLAVSIGGLTLLARFADVPDFTPQLAGMIGLGVGIDYALFIVTRYRQELHAGRDGELATRVALATAGRAVVFAGLTVVVSLMAMLVMDISFVRGLALGAVAAVLTVMLASLTLLPALLGFAGRAIDRLRVPGLHRDESGHRRTFWFRWSRQVQRHPIVAVVTGGVVLLTLGVPALSMRLGIADAGHDPPSRTTRRAYDLLAEGFGAGFNGPLVLAAEMPDRARGEPVLARVQKTVGATPGVAFVVPAEVSDDGRAAIVTVFPSSAPQDRATAELVHRLRSDVLPAATAGTPVHVLVGGRTAVGIDLSSYLGDRMPLFIGIVLALSFLVLLVVFRSVLVPLKAAVMNVLSIAAAYGVVTAVFQWGWAASLIGLHRPGPIEPVAPMMLFAVVFGLSMDYEVFLLSRCHEEWVRTGDNAGAVADALATTARVITAAAAIMVAVFVSFAFAGDRVVQLFGVGLAAAILIDATLVRMLLVPATMELLGDANWWLPRWLDRIIPDLDIEGEHHLPPATTPEAERAIAEASDPTDLGL